MGIARNLARLVPNGSGLLPNANIEAVAASKLTGQVADANAPSGSVLQVVSTIKTDTFSMTGGLTDITGLTATITPISASSKIMIFVNSFQSNSSSSGLTTYNLLRGATNICQPSNTGLAFSGSANVYIQNVDSIFPFSISFLDSPATTSATTYKVQVKSNTGTVYINRRETADSAMPSTITLMEIAA
jgi:hypothetical protein